MQKFEFSTYLVASPEAVRKHVQQPDLFLYVSKGVFRFEPAEPETFPETWVPGKYRVKVYWKGFLPLGWQMIVIEPQPMRGDTWSMRDNGYSPLINSWDHMIEISPEGDGTRYVDRISLEAGLLTPLVALFVQQFFRHRQQRLNRLSSNAFDYSR